MSDEEEFSLSAINQQREQSGSSLSNPPPAAVDTEPLESIAPPPRPADDEEEDEGGIPLPFDPLRLLLAGIRVLPIGVLLGLVLAAGGYFFADVRFQPTYAVGGQLMKVEMRDFFRTLEVGESFRPRELSLPTMVNVMASRSILEKVGSQMNPPLSHRELRAGLSITPERETELVSVEFKSARSPQNTVDVLNSYLREVVKMTKDLQTDEANEVNHYLTKQITALETESKNLSDKINKFSREKKVIAVDKEIGAYLGELVNLNLQLETLRVEQETLDLRITSLEKELAKQNPMAQQIAAANQNVEDLLVKYTEENPLVIEARARQESVRKKFEQSKDQEMAFQPGGAPVADSLYLDIVKYRTDKESLAVQITKLEKYRLTVQAKLADLPEKGLEYAKLQAREETLSRTMRLLGARKRETELYLENAPGLYRTSTFARIDDVMSYGSRKMVFAAAGAGLGIGVLLICLFGMIIETLDERIKSAMDVTRVTRLKLLGRLGLLQDLSAADQNSWAFRTWTQWSGQLSQREDFPVVLGFLSGARREGRSTWIELLSGCATNRGNRTIIVINREPTEATAGTFQLDEALADPRRVNRALLATDAGRICLVMPDTWTWDLQQRKRWHAALKTWHEVPGSYVFLELPPAEDPEALLLAEQVTDLIWLAAPTFQRASETSEQIQTLRDSRVNLLGAVLNKDVGLSRQFFTLPRKLRKLLAALILLLALNDGTASAAEKPTANQATGPEPAGSIPSDVIGTALRNYSTDNPLPTDQVFPLSASSRPQLAPWQERLTLGPGDEINISMYKIPRSQRAEVKIGPDGKIDYFQAENVMAGGRTIDELSAELSRLMSAYYRNVRVMVTPHQFKSKKYFMLGKVTQKGVYPLDRPMTIIEATAKAFGLEIGLFNHNTVELADLNHSFLMRRGEKMPVDFYRLFMQGDLSQNIPLEPDDYLYFASAVANDFFVLGAVKTPGKVGYLPDTTLITAVVQRGGFTEDAYLDKILIVRGSLTKPETFEISAADILAGRAKDFHVQPKDIVYVSTKPWKRASELLDMAGSAFVQAAVTGWTGQNIGPFITSPIVPGI
jgi:protein involved in polysaccharide export with SLBB domain/capsular polysaccharide biosynthesis protein